MSNLIPNIITGDDVGLQIQLTKDTLNFNIDSSATIKASIVSKDRKTVLIDPVAVTRIVLDPEDGVTPLSDWPNSLLFVQFGSLDTNAIPATYIGQGALLEIQVDDTTNGFGKETWFYKVKVLQGTIDQ